jgi:hypothetical protein
MTSMIQLQTCLILWRNHFSHFVDDVHLHFLVWARSEFSPRFHFATAAPFLVLVFCPCG